MQTAITMKGKLPPECTKVEVMKYMRGWSNDDYLNAPEELIDTIVAMINSERVITQQDTSDAEARARFASYQRY